MIKLRDYQKAANTKTMFWLQNKGKHGIVVVPTAGGKSILIADLINRILNLWPTQILILSHSKEILEQDIEKLSKYLPADKIGIYSASLGKREVKDITFGSVQTVVGALDKFENVRLIIVDECHAIQKNGEGSYNKIFKALPKARVIGYTATPFRYNGPLVSDSHIFDEIIYSISIQTLLSKGYLAPLRVKATKVEIDTSKIKITRGEYNRKSMEEEIDRFGLTSQLCKDMVKFKDKRKHWLIFCVSINHAEHVAAELSKYGIATATVHSKMTKEERETVLRLYKAGKIQAMANVGVLTTGFDFPDIDLLAFLRPTRSHVLHRQASGRGMRIAEGKTDCLVLDYAGNFKRLGPIDVDPTFPKNGKEGSGKGALTKICPKCDEIVALSTRVCPACNYEFPRQEKLHLGSIAAPALSTDKVDYIKTYKVSKVFYSKYQKKRKPNTLLVTYKVGPLTTVKEWVHFESPYPAIKKTAKEWWYKRTGYPFPHTVDEALSLVDILKPPKYIEVDESGKFPKIVDVYFTEIKKPQEKSLLNSSAKDAV